MAASDDFTFIDNGAVKQIKQWHTIKPGTLEHGTTEYGTSAEHRNTPKQWRNNCILPGTPAEHPGTTEPYFSSAFKRKFKTQNLNLQLKVEALFIADINYLFISLYLRLVYM